MAFDGFITKAIITELKNTIIGGKINKINVPTKTDVVLSIYNQGNNYSLNLCANPEFCRVSFTTFSKPNPQNAYNFCMLLRKYLIGGRITNISSFDLERTIEIDFECYNELNDLVSRKLFIEIMSRQSNVILTNEKNVIIDTLRHTDSSSRELLPAHEYQFTPINKISFIDITEKAFIDSINKEDSIINNLTNTYIGFSKPLIKKALSILDIDNQNYSDNDLLNIFNYFKNIINSFGTNKIKCVFVNDNKDYTLIYDENNINNEDVSLPPINDFVNSFYINKEQATLFTNSRNSLLKIASSALKKVIKKLDNINQKLSECDQMDNYRLYGELLTANLYKFNNLPNLDKIDVENYYENNKIISIPLDKSVNINKNIEKYFKKYNKLKNALEIVSAQKSEAEKELDYIESIVYSLSSAKNLKDINEIYEEISENVNTKKEVYKTKNNKKKQQSEDNKTTFDSVIIDGYTIYIGKNNIQNDYLSLRYANPNDIWFHTQKFHGSHILLRNNENQKIEEIPENVLFNCAKLAKENSKASDSLNVSVDYCYSRYVKKISGAKPGMVNYTNFKTIIVK